MDHPLEKLFGSPARVRLLRLFLQNAEHQFVLPEIVSWSRINEKTVKSEVNRFLTIGLIRKKIGYLNAEENGKAERKVQKTQKILLKKVTIYTVNQQFEFYRELHDLITRSTTASRKKLLRQIKGLGGVKLAILSGVFLNREDTGRTDLLVVGDNLSKRKLDNMLAQTESELGKAVSYTIMETEEFKYRRNMFDRFLRDIFEYPHEKLINKFDI
ncbi:MAG: hypothetical protein HYT37_03880 [Candidatus Sungbacteria bacterium]|nr:hypothetical protein [Candidatus Sungbacteria bacterium]